MITENQGFLGKAVSKSLTAFIFSGKKRRPNGIAPTTWLDKKSLHSPGVKSCKLTSSLAHWLTGYEYLERGCGKFYSRRQCNRELGLVVVLLSTLLLTGCANRSDNTVGFARLSAQAERGTSSLPVLEWDCGVVLPQECTSITFPLHLPGVELSDDIIRVQASCDCTEINVRDAIAANEDILVVAQVVIDRTREQISQAAQQLLVNVSFEAIGGEY